MSKLHSFHIPVMGIGFTIDSPIKVAHLGIDSVISLVDDILIEKMRKNYSEKLKLPFQKITNREQDFRAKRITSYLNLVKKIAEDKFENLKAIALEGKKEFYAYLQTLPNYEILKKDFEHLLAKPLPLKERIAWFKKNISMGSIDVNIMTKLDKPNFKNGEKLDSLYNDAHAALRGFANSELSSSIILSAGMNPRLYSYMATFDSFFPDARGNFKKKIILKVSDYRSALIQGKFLAKNGLWVSEYRIESGLNCGGHAFATDGFLLGPVLEEFKSKRKQLQDAVFGVLRKSLSDKAKLVPSSLVSKVTVQGGVGTAEEHDFLLEHYELDSIGWGTPFLLVPEATTVDEQTMQKLEAAKEKDLYLSDISPLGVPFNNLRNNTKDIEKEKLIKKGKPGSLCPKKYIQLNYEYRKEGLCTASAHYQRIRIKELKDKELSSEKYQAAYEKITERSCICVGLGTAALVANKLDTRTEGDGISICPGPNMAYFSQKISLQRICEHIYGRTNIIERIDRPQMFIKELSLYIHYIQDKIRENAQDFSAKQEKYIDSFTKNLEDGILYYQKLFSKIKGRFISAREEIIKELEYKNLVLQKLRVKDKL